MNRAATAWRTALSWVALSAVPTAYLEGLRWLAGAPLSWTGLTSRWVFVAGLLLATRWTQPYAAGGTVSVWPWTGGLVAGAAGAAALVYAACEATWAAWVLVGTLYLLLLGLDRMLASRRGRLSRWGVHSLLALVAGAAPVTITQMESRFSEEEFFVAVQAVALSLFWALLLAAGSLLARHTARPARRGLRIVGRWLFPLLVLFILVGLGTTVYVYQQSFYPANAPGYEGITEEAPFLCGEVVPDSQTYAGHEVFARLLAQVESNPHAGPLEFAMLALGTGERRWAETFRESLLNEATEGRFAAPAHSVKSVQYEAALRIYYLSRIEIAFPDLLSHDDWTRLRSWFSAINRRALTVEPVDWMYGLAFGKWPEGPYENQENGAGLLALLEVSGLAAPDLSPTNRDYLERNQRGWTARFRNTDDVYVYQPAWIHNAYFQSLYTGEVAERNLRLAFEWLLLQAIPDGAPVRYNHPSASSLASIAYLGAHLLEDPRYVWLAGRALAYTEEQGKPLFARPGTEQSLSLIGHSPTQGSCLLYGDSGLPNQPGPLAPDKIVFRDGWSEEAGYLLLNLRFSGWHRYKATNTVTLLYQDGLLAGDALHGEPFRWLPVGRSVFRDKRIPRENLNGLLIERSGMGAVLYQLTGVGGPWAQDPPLYAQVVGIETGSDLDWSHTRLGDWRGWQHDRWIYFHHQGGPIVVVDEARGPAGSQAALAWQIAGEGDMSGQRVRLRAGDQPAEMLILPTDGGDLRLEAMDHQAGSPSQRMIYYAPEAGRLQVVTVFLLGTWAGAEAELEEDHQTLRIAQGQRSITVPLHFSGEASR
jgi:hypothetical protein